MYIKRHIKVTRELLKAIVHLDLRERFDEKLKKRGNDFGSFKIPRFKIIPTEKDNVQALLSN